MGVTGGCNGWVRWVGVMGGWMGGWMGGCDGWV